VSSVAPTVAPARDIIGIRATAQAPAPKRGLALIPVAELLAQQRFSEFLIDGLIESNCSIGLVAPPEHGKSLLVQNMAACVATGHEFHGRGVKRGLAVYLCGEGHHGATRRFQALEVRHGMGLAGAPLVISNCAASLLAGPEVQHIADSIRAAEDRYQLPLTLLVVDTLARFVGDGDESKAQDMGAYMAAVDALRGEASAISCHHPGHSDRTRGRGSSSWLAGLDAAFSMHSAAGVLTQSMRMALRSVQWCLCQPKRRYRSERSKERTARQSSDCWPNIGDRPVAPKSRAKSFAAGLSRPASTVNAFPKSHQHLRGTDFLFLLLMAGHSDTVCRECPKVRIAYENAISDGVFLSGMSDDSLSRTLRTHPSWRGDRRLTMACAFNDETFVDLLHMRAWRGMPRWARIPRRSGGRLESERFRHLLRLFARKTRMLFHCVRDGIVALRQLGHSVPLVLLLASRRVGLGDLFFWRVHGDLTFVRL
jgi:hypothetical protein